MVIEECDRIYCAEEDLDTTKVSNYAIDTNVFEAYPTNMHQFADEDDNFVYENVRNGTNYWGGTFELKILANFLNRAIVSINTYTNETSVHTPDLTQAATAVDGDMIATYDKLSTAAEPPMYLLYSPQLGAQHYAAVLMRQERPPVTNTITGAGTGAGLPHDTNHQGDRKQRCTLDDTESEDDTDTESKLQHNRKRGQPKTGQHRRKKKRKK